MPPDACRLLDDLRCLQERLVRLLGAVALSSETACMVLEQLADSDRAHRDERLRDAQVLRERATLYQEMLQLARQAAS